jgi:hypothetical protein
MNERASMLAAHIGLASNDGDFDKTILQMQRLRNHYLATGNTSGADNADDAITCVKAIQVAAMLTTDVSTRSAPDDA